MREISGQSPAELRAKLSKKMARRRLVTLRQQNTDAIKVSSATPVTPLQLQVPVLAPPLTPLQLLLISL